MNKKHKNAKVEGTRRKDRISQRRKDDNQNSHRKSKNAQTQANPKSSLKSYFWSVTYLQSACFVVHFYACEREFGFPAVRQEPLVPGALNAFQKNRDWCIDSNLDQSHEMS